jgi:thiol-disulfide isomerase/thioredoxin
MIKHGLGYVAAVTSAIRQGWRNLAARNRTLLALILGLLAWQGLLAGLRLINTPPLSEVKVTRLSGESTNLAALAGSKPMVVNLWASWCPPCRREMPVLAAAQKHESGISFVFANQGESGAAVLSYLSASQLDLANVVLDPDTRVGFLAGSSALPITLFYDAGGKLIGAHLGALTLDSLARNLDRLRTGPISKP